PGSDPAHLQRAGQWIWSSWPGIDEGSTDVEAVDRVVAAKASLGCDRLLPGVAEGRKPDQSGDFALPVDWIGSTHDGSVKGLPAHLAGARLSMSIARADVAADDDAK